MSEPQFEVFLIDDDDDDLELLSSLLALNGIRYKCAASGEKAIFYLKLISDIAELPLLIILDYNMPGINGQQVLDLIKNNNHIRDIPVVMYSTTMSSLLKRSLIEHGAFDCYTKADSYSGLKAQAEVFKELVDSFQQVKRGTKAADSILYTA